MLGEARLTDAAGRTADFSNCVVIMTSNLGAREFARGRLGFQQDGETWRNAVEHFTAAVQAVLRPEMFNRIDSIVPYRPLSEEVVESLTRRSWRRSPSVPASRGASCVWRSRNLSSSIWPGRGMIPAMARVR
nr:AAA family ATPase [Verrucomicrobium spinosum]